MLKVEDIFDDIVAFRHRLHRIPEIAGSEIKTQKAIRDYISDLPLEVLPPFLETDTVALLKGGKGDGPNVTLRADIDALPIAEQSGLDFASEHPGMMHACGHDFHTAMLAGAARVLSSYKDDIRGSVRFVWQPGEECVAMGRDLVEAGVLENPLPDRMTAIHVFPGVKEGVIATKPGAVMASSTHFKVTVHGKSGHGSVPFKSVSPLLAAAAMITDLQQIIPNRVDPHKVAVLSFGVFKAGEIENVIPDEAMFAGTIRSLDMDTAHLVADSLQEICQGLAAAYRVKADIDIHWSYAVTDNDPQQVEYALNAARKAGVETEIVAQSSMGAEDFSYFLDRAPGVFVRLGAGDIPPLHSSKMVPRDEIMKNGIRYLVEFALDALK